MSNLDKKRSVILCPRKTQRYCAGMWQQYSSSDLVASRYLLLLRLQTGKNTIANPHKKAEAYHTCIPCFLKPPLSHFLCHLEAISWKEKTKPFHIGFWKGILCMTCQLQGTSGAKGFKSHIFSWQQQCYHWLKIILEICFGRQGQLVRFNGLAFYPFFCPDLFKSPALCILRAGDFQDAMLWARPGREAVKPASKNKGWCDIGL